MMTANAPKLDRFLDALAAKARDAAVFGPVQVQDGRLLCDAKESAAPAQYRLEHVDGQVWVFLVTKDRWLSESIETDLLHTNDKLNELVDEELAELDYQGPPSTFLHYRSDDKHFTFRTPTGVSVRDAESASPAAIHAAATFLLAYEACFRNLGDMQGGDED